MLHESVAATQINQNIRYCSRKHEISIVTTNHRNPNSEVFNLVTYNP